MLAMALRKIRLLQCWYKLLQFILFLLQKPGAMQLKTNAICKHFKLFPNLQLGDRKSPQVILSILPEA